MTYLRNQINQVFRDDMHQTVWNYMMIQNKRNFRHKSLAKSEGISRDHDVLPQSIRL